MSIKLKLEGFEEMLREIEKASGSVDKSVKTCLERSAKIMETELKSEMEHSEVKKGLIDRMPESVIENNHGLQTARVGYEKGAYDPKNISDAYKVIFLNYGTPHRQKHGKVKARGFIQRAKRKAKSKIYKVQQQTLEDILKGLKQ